MPETFFTSDTHFGHHSIIEHCSRPFASLEEMDEAMIAKWNERVQPRDEVWHLGDFAWRDHLRYKSRLNGKIHWVLGNHDRCSAAVKQQFTSVQEVFHGSINDREFFLFHYPCVSWWKKAHNSVHLYGHVHGRYNRTGELSLDAGVDPNNFYPLSFDEVITKTNDKRSSLDICPILQP